MAKVPVVPMTTDRLKALTEPRSTPGGNMEAYRHILYDTQTYPAAGAAAPLTFFQVTNADRTLSNMEQAGTLPDPKFLQLWYVSCDIILPVAADAAPQQLQDLANLISVGRPIFSLIISDKEYGPWPLSFLHCSGGVVGFGYAAAAVAATATEYGNNGIMDGGFCTDGAIVIPPKVGFNATIRWGNPQAVLADTLIRVNLDGVISRRIL